MIIRTPDQRLRVFISSTLKELAEERKAARKAILSLHLTPVMFEDGARPHPPKALYQSYLLQSQVFVGVYWQSYGWIGPGMSISGLEDEYNLSLNLPRLIYIKDPAPNRDLGLTNLLNRIKQDNASCYTSFSASSELAELIQNDLALLLSEHYQDKNTISLQSSDSDRASKTNLPVPRYPLINRNQELITMRDLLRQDDFALITLTGVGGTGKSRLALQVGKEMLEHFKDGVYLVRLESINDASLVIPTVGEALGIHTTSGSRPIDDMLVEFLRDKQLLLILDNFEQVVTAAPFIARLLESCPQMKSIVTSRIPLRLRMEKVIAVPPLNVPLQKNSTDLDNLSQFAAVELFIQRAQAVKTGFTVTNTNASAIAEICHRLDGLPLAIELAAARVKLLTPQELLNRLGNRFDLLNNGARDLPERQRTLRDAIDWSYNLLGDNEKKLFRRLSVFVGGWTLEAVYDVCSIDDDITPDLDDTLTSLIDANLVISNRWDQESNRFDMLSTIHEYASERLEESGEADAIHAQHARYYLNFIKMAEPCIRSVERIHWQQLMQQELGNIRIVLEWITTSGKCREIGQQIVITIGMLWVTSGYFAEGKNWCDRILSLSDETTPISIHAALLGIAGLIAWTHCEYQSAMVSLDKSLELLNTMDDKTLDEKHILGQALFVRGMVASATRDLTTGMATIQRSIELFSETNDPWFEAIAFSWLGDLALYANDRKHAKNLHNHSIELARAQGDPWCLVPALLSSARVALADRDLAKSHSILLEAVDLLRDAGDQWSLSNALNELGNVALLEGDLTEANTFLDEGLSLAYALGNVRILVIALPATAAVITRSCSHSTDSQQIQCPELALAARLCGASVPLTNKPGAFIWIDTKMLYEESVTQVKSLLDEQTWTKNYSEGQGLLLGQVVNDGIHTLRKIISLQPDPIQATNHDLIRVFQ